MPVYEKRTYSITVDVCQTLYDLHRRRMAGA